MKQKGFTLIELMVAISITAVLGTLGIAGFVNYNQTQVLQTSTNEVVTMLNLAKSRAQSQVKIGTSCGSTSQILEGYMVDLSVSNKSYTLSSRCSGAVSVISTKILPQNISFGSPTSPASFFFPVQTGGVQNFGCIMLSGYGQDKYIAVNSLGRVSVQLLPCVFTPTPTPTLIPTATPTPIPPTPTPTIPPPFTFSNPLVSAQTCILGSAWWTPNYDCDIKNNNAMTVTHTITFWYESYSYTYNTLYPPHSITSFPLTLAPGVSYHYHYLINNVDSCDPTIGMHYTIYYYLQDAYGTQSTKVSVYRP